MVAVSLLGAHRLSSWVTVVCLVTYGQATAGPLCPGFVGAALFHVAWPTAKFKSCTFDSVKNLAKLQDGSDGGHEVTFKLVGDSRLRGSEIYVKGTANFSSDWAHVTEVRWSEHNGLVAPGKTSKAALAAYAKYRAENPAP